MCRFVAYYNFEPIFGPHRPWRFMSIKITFQLLSLRWILQLNVKSVRHAAHKIRCLNLHELKYEYNNGASFQIFILFVH